jgi:UDP-N-acetyl-D-glucosamine dehydrogenase
MREHQFDLKSIDLNEKNLSEQDAVVIATAHDGFDFEFIKTHANLIIDTRGVYRDYNPKIIKA